MRMNREWDKTLASSAILRNSLAASLAGTFSLATTPEVHADSGFHVLEHSRRLADDGGNDAPADDAADAPAAPDAGDAPAAPPAHADAGAHDEVTIEDGVAEATTPSLDRKHDHHHNHHNHDDHDYHYHHFVDRKVLARLQGAP